MSRFLRELRETEGTPSAVGRLRRGLCALGVLVGGSLSASCLVTNQFEFATPDTPPTVAAVSPPGFSRVPNYNDQDCPDATAPSLRFDFLVTEPDTLASVWAQLYVNGNSVLIPIPLEADATGSATRRTSKPICIAHSAFVRPCNRVQLVVSNLYPAMDTPPPIDGALNPRINFVQWFVLGKSQNAADAVPSDCAQLLARDAGAGISLPDAAASPSPVDAGSLLPVGTSPPTSDGGP